MSTNPQPRSNELVEEKIVKQRVPRYYETMNQFYNLDLFCSVYLMGIKGIVQIISGYLNEACILQDVPGKQLTRFKPYYQNWWLREDSWLYAFMDEYRVPFFDQNLETDLTKWEKVNWFELNMNI